MSKQQIKDTYIIECLCINESNDFNMRKGFRGYYNKNANTFRYQTQFSTVSWIGSIQKYDEPDNVNPYFGDVWHGAVPVTPNIDNAKVYKRLADVEKIIAEIENVGDFKCRILVLRTEIIPLEEIGPNGY